MKRSIIIALALALTIGTAAIAEVADTTENLEITAPVEEAEAAPTGEEAAVEAEAPAVAAPTGDAVALEDALKALRDARQEARTEKLKAELDEYVTSGKLTQDQADLILKYVQERQAGKQSDQRGYKQRGQMHGNGQQPPMPNNGQFGGQMPGNSQFGGQMPGNGQCPQMGGNGQFGGQMPQMGGHMMPDANSGATPQMPGNHR